MSLSPIFLASRFILCWVWNIASLIKWRFHDHIIALYVCYHTCTTPLWNRADLVYPGFRHACVLGQVASDSKLGPPLEHLALSQWLFLTWVHIWTIFERQWSFRIVSLWWWMFGCFGDKVREKGSLMTMLLMWHLSWSVRHLKFLG